MRCVVAVLFLLGSAVSWADELCDDQGHLDTMSLLRRTSLDLRQSVPDYEALTAMEGYTAIPDALIDEWLASEAFVRVIRRHHETLIWPNLDEVELVTGTQSLFPAPVGGETIYLSFERGIFARSVAGALYRPCENRPAEFDEDGALILEEVYDNEALVAYDEGYVEVSPYWAPETTIKVCAFDAQTADFAEVCPGPRERYPFAEPICGNLDRLSGFVQAPFRSSEVACDGPLARFAPGCGCGPNLERCQGPEAGGRVRTALLEQSLRIVERNIREDASYDQILLDSELEVNGVISHYLRHQARLNFDLYAGEPSHDAPPDLGFLQDEWQFDAGPKRAAGVLTTAGYLLRFSTQRARAHRFVNAFLCQDFVPAGDLFPPDNPCSQHEDLTQRCGCDACHLTLEPMAAHWGRFAEYGFGELDTATYPKQLTFLNREAVCGGDLESFLRCSRFYELDPVGEEEGFRGMLNAYVFRQPAEHERIESGPRALVQETIKDGRFDACTVDRMWRLLIRRPATSLEKQTLVKTLEDEFRANGRSLRWLVRRLVTDKIYAEVSR